MKAKDLFTIILKIFGIYLIKDILLSIPDVLVNLYRLTIIAEDFALTSLAFSLLAFGLYIVIVYVLLFRTEWLISRLQLTSALSEEPLLVNLHRSSVYTIAIIVAGIVILTFSVPELVQRVYTWYRYIDASRWQVGLDYFDYAPIITSIAEVIIGLLFLGNQRTIVNFIESRRRQSKTQL